MKSFSKLKCHLIEISYTGLAIHLKLAKDRKESWKLQQIFKIIKPFEWNKSSFRTAKIFTV